MYIRFQSFRRFLTGLKVITSTVSIILSLYLLPFFSHRNTLWVVVGFQAFGMLRFLWSTFRKSMFKTPQKVASEAIGLFALLPFEIIIALLIVTVAPNENSNVLLTFTILQISIFINAAIHTLYTVCILTTAMLTVCAFDKDVWYRDIDSSPSPFPMSILLYFVFPCLSRWSPSPITPVEMEEDDTHPAVLCLPGCGCTTKPQMTQMTRTPTMTPALLNIHDSVSTLQSSTPQRLGNSASLSRSLVRIPNATERRESIVIAFEV